MTLKMRMRGEWRTVERAEKTRLESEKERIELEKSHVARDQTHLQEEIEQTEGRVPKFHSSKWKFRGHYLNLAMIK